MSDKAGAFEDRVWARIWSRFVAREEAIWARRVREGKTDGYFTANEMIARYSNPWVRPHWLECFGDEVAAELRKEDAEAAAKAERTTEASTVVDADAPDPPNARKAARPRSARGVSDPLAKLRERAVKLRAMGWSDRAIRSELRVGWPTLHQLIVPLGHHSTKKSRARFARYHQRRGAD